MLLIKSRSKMTNICEIEVNHNFASERRLWSRTDC